ncbi:MAG: bifunctional pyr operon transcriptional regulator/uracil phosphoribosyltransferase [Opitutae bacterium]|nr:bifunctional pyr operon transcriptional regulator/uracil phosphoribosyltransferase [Opitutae bacterium]MBG29415.1 bifunctional pyr operon transcriptional regulator/uracil phosphoribosyltransferase [Opitutae bacterium]
MTISNNKEFSSSDIELALDRISDEIATNHRDTAELFLVGIAEGGVPMARRLASKISKKLDRKILHGVVDVSFHRDDIGSKPIPKISSPTEIPEIVDGGTCVLVDDVIHTGRSTRAALNELFDQGRLRRIELAVLVDRGNRKLPIQPDYVGFAEDISNNQEVTVEMDSNDSTRDNIQITAK